MGLFYLLHEYADRYHSDYPLGRKFARTVILGSIFYYLLYFVLPLYLPPNYSSQLQHFLRYFIIVDIVASSIFYGGVLNGLSFWSRGTTSNGSPSNDGVFPRVVNVLNSITNDNDDDNDVIILDNGPRVPDTAGDVVRDTVGNDSSDSDSGDSDAGTSGSDTD